MAKVFMPFQHPSTMVLAGPTMCGKTRMLMKMLARHAIQPPPQRIVLVYGEWQDAYDEQEALGEAGVVLRTEFVKDFDAALYETLDPSVRKLVILDDQMENDSVHKSKKGGHHLSKYFTQGAHHRNLTVIYIVQNLYHQDRSMRTITLNSHYLVLFNIPRDKTQVRTLGQQMYPNNPKFLPAAYDDATQEPYGYLVIDLRPNTSNLTRIRTKVLESSTPTFYVPPSV